MKNIYTILFVCVSWISFGQEKTEADEYASTITIEDLKGHLEIIASDALEGRETGERGQKMAAAYIKAHFQSLGLAGPVDSEYGEGYYQKMPLYVSKPGKSYIKLEGKTLENGLDLIYTGSSEMKMEKTYPVVFAGKGSADEFASLDLEGKIVLIQNSSNSPRALRNYVAKSSAAGASGLILESANEDDWKNTLAWYNRYLTGGRLSLSKPEGNNGMPAFIVKPGKAAEILDTNSEKLKKALSNFIDGKKSAYKKMENEIVLKTSLNISTVYSENVLGYLEGTDKKDELVVITAHYDHVGKNGQDIYNGADDDGSGTVTVLELAEAFVKAKKEGKGPRRSILFMTVTGEEKGLLGSNYYTQHPVFPLENTVVNLNIDMVGRIDPEHKGNDKYVYLVGSNRLSSELHEISEQVNKTFTQLELDYTYNDEDHPDRIYYRSDHWNFAKNNVPIIFYFNGVHEDYHKPTDTVDKIEFEALKHRANLVFYTAWVLANREDRVVADKVQGAIIEKK